MASGLGLLGVIVNVGSDLLGVATSVGRAVSDGVGAGGGAAVGTGWLDVGTAVGPALAVDAGVAVAICVGATVGALSTDAGVSPIPEHPNKTATTTPTANVEE